MYSMGVGGSCSMHNPWPVGALLLAAGHRGTHRAWIDKIYLRRLGQSNVHILRCARANPGKLSVSQCRASSRWS